MLKDRGKYIAAALTICRAYFVAGSPDKAARLASFEGWSDTVRSALIWLGKADPVKSIEASRAEDPERLELMNMMDAWNNTLRYRLWQPLEACRRAVEGCGDSTGNAAQNWSQSFPSCTPRWKRSVSEAPADAINPTPGMLGNWLNRYKGQNHQREEVLIPAQP